MKIGFLRFIDIIIKTIIFLPYTKFLLLHSFGLRAFIIEDIVTWMAFFIKKPIIIRLHGGSFIDFYRQHEKWVSRVLKRATVICTPSLFIQKNLKELGVKVEYLPNFVNLRDFKFIKDSKNKYSLLWVRAFQELYDPELAIKTVFFLKRKYPEVKLTMVGHDQGSLDSCIKLIKDNNLDDQIILAGRIKNTELSKFYHTHHVFLTTTKYESFGVSTIEAAACGIPCVCVPVGEIPFIWTDRENVLFAERSPEDFAEKISELFENSELVQKISANARKNAERFTWENVKPYWINTINGLMKKNNVRN